MVDVLSMHGQGVSSALWNIPPGFGIRVWKEVFISEYAPGIKDDTKQPWFRYAPTFDYLI